MPAKSAPMVEKFPFVGSRRLSRVLTRLEFHVLLFVVALLEFCKPALLAWQ